MSHPRRYLSVDRFFSAPALHDKQEQHVTKENPNNQQLLQRCIKKLCLLNIGVLLLLTGNAQFYYTDIVLTARNSEQQKLYKESQVKNVHLVSYEADGERSEDFTCEVTTNAAYNKTVTNTRSAASGASILTAFYQPDGKLSSSTDSTAENINRYSYSYNSNGLLAVATSISQNATGKDKQLETHVWEYNNNGKPVKMLWIKNGRDTAVVQFKLDEKLNVVEEETFSKGISKEKVYYYYDEQNRLTDIVRYNNRLKKLLPDNIFEYSDDGRLYQMLSLQNGGNDYLIWRYEYNEAGLKTRELCYNKQKKLLGRIEYGYER
ncbi:MAG: hypothetical protein ACTHMM_15565 [Agriterribacter sp.]